MASPAVLGERGDGADRSLILTAAHCLVVPGEQSGGRGIIWASNVAFQPGFRDERQPVRRLRRHRRSATPSAFAQSGDVSFDLGAVNLAPGASGLIQDALGARGIAFNRSPRQVQEQQLRGLGLSRRCRRPHYDGQRPDPLLHDLPGVRDLHLAPRSSLPATSSRARAAAASSAAARSSPSSATPAASTSPAAP